MDTYTNMAWPGDPYRTGQLLYPRPAPRLAAFTAGPPAGWNPLMTASAAIVYLPLHRTKAITVTGQTLAFGFRAVSICGEAEAAALAAVAGLDLLAARRHAAILAGYMLHGDLGKLQPPYAPARFRGLSAVQEEWAGRHTPARGKAVLYDCSDGLPGTRSLEHACQDACLATRPAGAAGGQDAEAAAPVLAALAVERALAIALVCARRMGRYTWDGTLSTGDIMTVSTWDCLPQPGTSRPAGAPAAATVSDAGRSPAALTGALRDHHQ
jgi:hypothetical protein